MAPLRGARGKPEQNETDERTTKPKAMKKVVWKGTKGTQWTRGTKRTKGTKGTKLGGCELRAELAYFSEVGSGCMHPRSTSTYSRSSRERFPVPWNRFCIQVLRPLPSSYRPTSPATFSSSPPFPKSMLSRSPSPARSRSSSPPLELDPNTLALLNNFYSERTQLEEEFAALEAKAQARLDQAQAGGEAEPERMSVDEFRRLFGEDWQLSQFW